MKLDLTAAGYIFHDNKLLLIHHTKLNMWLPVGGHIELNESPDNAVLREIEEETCIKARIVDVLPSDVPLKPELARQTAVPFYTNIHSVGDHEHWCACYLCECDSDVVQIDKDSRGFRWLTKEQIQSDNHLREDIRAIALLAFDHYHRLRN